MIILAHVSPPNILFQIRNFDVPFMVFLSGILAADSLKREKKKAAYRFSGYIRKRVSRLLLPTWCFLGFYFVALHMLGVQFSSAVIMKSFLLQHDSIGYVWVIWIYLMCGIMVPFFDRISTHRLLMLAGCAAAYLVFEICFARRLGTGSRITALGNRPKKGLLQLECWYICFLQFIFIGSTGDISPRRYINTPHGFIT